MSQEIIKLNPEEEAGANGVEIMNQMSDWINVYAAGYPSFDIHVESFLGQEKYGVLFAERYDGETGYLVLEKLYDDESRPFVIYCADIPEGIVGD